VCSLENLERRKGGKEERRKGGKEERRKLCAFFKRLVIFRRSDEDNSTIRRHIDIVCLHQRNAMG
jgi:hypothetical protein